MDKTNDFIVIIFFIFWLALGVGGVAFFYGCRDATLKRRWYSRWGAFGLVAVCVFCAYEDGLTVMAILVPWCIFTYYVSTSATEFCDGCGATWINKYWTTKVRICPRCGTNLTEAAKKRLSGASKTT